MPLERHAELEADRDRGERVLQVVHAGHGELNVALAGTVRASRESRNGRRSGRRARPDCGASAADVGVRCETVGDDAALEPRATSPPRARRRRSAITAP